MSTKNPLKVIAKDDDPSAIENMPGYVPPKLRKGWTPAEHCRFANDQLEWRKTNEYRRSKGLAPVRWILKDGTVVLEPL